MSSRPSQKVVEVAERARLFADWHCDLGLGVVPQLDGPG
jgi:hypothetical protein